MKKTETETGKEAVVGRRGFLRAVGLASGVAAAAAVVSTPEAKASGPKDSQGGSGYSETDHVRTYYDRARF